MHVKLLRGKISPLGRQDPEATPLNLISVLFVQVHYVQRSGARHGNHRDREGLVLKLFLPLVGK